jgi:hypothetical protein
MANAVISLSAFERGGQHSILGVGLVQAWRRRSKLKYSADRKRRFGISYCTRRRGDSPPTRTMASQQSINMHMESIQRYWSAVSNIAATIVSIGLTMLEFSIKCFRPARIVHSLTLNCRRKMPVKRLAWETVPNKTILLPSSVVEVLINLSVCIQRQGWWSLTCRAPETSNQWATEPCPKILRGGTADHPPHNMTCSVHRSLPIPEGPSSSATRVRLDTACSR